MGRKKLAEEIKHSNLSYEQLIVKGMLPRYRLSRWKEARDAVIQIPKVVKETQQSNPCNLATWNVNGINSKLPAVRSYMVGNSLAIMGIQEHLRTINPYVPGIREYVIFEKPREEGFRGHCLYVHQHLAAHERTARNKVWGEIETTLKSLTSIEDPLITLMGDLNDDTVTRNLKDKEGRYLDHVIHSPAAESLVDKTQVDDVSFDISDHWPVLIKTNLKNEELNEIAEKWVQTLNLIGEELHMLRIPQPAKQTYLNKKTKNLVKQSRKARALYNTALLENDHVNLPGLRKVNKTLVENEGANFHRTVQTAQGKSQSNQDNSPCFDENERLKTEPDSILRARAAYSEGLASDPTGISKDPSKWTHVPKKNLGGPRELLHIRQACDTLDEEEDGEVDGVALPNKLDAQAFLQAIRQIQRNSAPGKSGVLAIHLKKFLEVASAGGANDPSIDPSPQHHAGVHTAENSASTLE
ncbi:hypothetical protein PSTG_09793 [Puccinia striiformis f. sp. tritici PST-78]|uniref:Endonuclease/exonuclease/phosphatase domain-containing protein n=1 Tax=Puccinia striiformis f. sp. tritici PST-78 TaxID=1165861 RepID=A0A0L0VD73_9BASI|nr:hypothetical protein PSTG_09793 [Puccinia striiformis f. sp. tritici PST-78]